MRASYTSEESVGPCGRNGAIKRRGNLYRGAGMTADMLMDDGMGWGMDQARARQQMMGNGNGNGNGADGGNAAAGADNAEYEEGAG